MYVVILNDSRKLHVRSGNVELLLLLNQYDIRNMSMQNTMEDKDMVLGRAALSLDLDQQSLPSINAAEFSVESPSTIVGMITEIDDDDSQQSWYDFTSWPRHNIHDNVTTLEPLLTELENVVAANVTLGTQASVSNMTSTLANVFKSDIQVLKQQTHHMVESMPLIKYTLIANAQEVARMQLRSDDKIGVNHLPKDLLADTEEAVLP